MSLQVKNETTGEHVYASSDNPVPVQVIESDWGVTVASTGTTTLKSGAGELAGFTVTAIGTTPTLTIYDNTAASGTVIVPAMSTSATGSLPAIAVGAVFEWNFPEPFNTGATVVIGGTGTTTIRFKWR